MLTSEWGKLQYMMLRKAQRESSSKCYQRRKEISTGVHDCRLSRLPLRGYWMLSDAVSLAGYLTWMEPPDAGAIYLADQMKERAVDVGLRCKAGAIES